MKNIKFIFKSLGQSFRPVLFVMWLSIIASVLLQLTSINLQRLSVNFILQKSAWQSLLGALVLAGLAMLLFLVLSQVTEKYLCRFVNDRRKTLFSIFIHVALDETDNQNYLDSYKQYFPEFNRLVKEVLPNFLTIITTTLMMSATAAIWNLKILLIVVVTAAIYALTIPLTQQLEKLEAKDGENAEKIWQAYQNIIANRPVFIFYPQSLYFLQKLQALFSVSQRLSQSKAKIFACIYVLGGATNVVRELAILFIAFSYFEMPIGDVLALFSVTSFLNSAIAQLMNAYADLQKSVIALKKLTALAQLPVENQREVYPVFDQPFQARNLAYAWQADLLAFPDFELTKGEIVQICGGNGAGKSTLLAILAGIRNHKQGTLTYQQFDRRKLSHFVTQNQFIFDGTILDNITCFDPSPDIEKVRTLLEKVGLLPWLEEQTHGLRTEISAKEGLSGGQRQRLCICRALYQPSALLILDEPFASIDEQNVQKLIALFEHYQRQGGTIVLTSHQAKSHFGQVREISL
jgi:ABC-type bacteriocin/lantibiotic exporter with double-glycine peptidase domain